MKYKELKEFNNIEDVDVDKIPQNVIDSIADLFFGMMMKAEAAEEKKAV